MSCRTRLLALAPAFAALACASPASAAPRTYTVLIKDMKFSGVPAEVKIGDRIVWVNRDIFRHTATDGGGKGFDVDLSPGQSGSWVANRAKAIAFFCRYHPGMRGSLNVRK